MKLAVLHSFCILVLTQQLTSSKPFAEKCISVVHSTVSSVTACVRDSSTGCGSYNAIRLITAYIEVHMHPVLADHLHPAHTMFQLS